MYLIKFKILINQRRSSFICQPQLYIKCIDIEIVGLAPKLLTNPNGYNIHQVYITCHMTVKHFQSELKLSVLRH